MNKSIFSRLMSVFILLLVVSFTITGVMLYFFLDSFVSDEKEKLLLQGQEEIATFLSEYVEYMPNPVVERTLRYLLKVYEDNTKAHFWIVDTEGNILYTRKEMVEFAIPSEILSKMKVEAPGHVRFIDERQYKKFMLGQQTYIEKGDFYGLFDDSKGPWLTIVKPFAYRGKVQGAIYSFAAMPKIKEARTSVFKLFIISVFFAVIISIFLVFIFSRKLTKPLKQINEAAKIIAGGDLRRRVAVNSKDEIGELAISFNQMVMSLQNLEEMRRGFIANVSHELRTPMTSIKGFLEGVLDGTVPTEKQNYYLNIVKEEIGRLSRLVNDLLDLARMESGEIKLNFMDFNINELARRSILKLEKLVVDKNIAVEADFEYEDEYANADIDAIERVILNLLDNAIKFTSDHGKITIKTWKQKGKIYVAISDTGIGIDKDELPLIFDRFYKSDKSRSKDKTGTGLGLAIIKNILNEHNQTIKVNSEQGKGTRFVFSLNTTNKENIES